MGRRRELRERATPSPAIDMEVEGIQCVNWGEPNRQATW
jgi:hypothetical protein